MKRENQKESFMNQMWNTQKGKALIKLGIWFLFFCLIGILLLFSEPNVQTKKQETPKVQEEKYLTLDNMFENLLENDYEYQIEILDKETEERITYNGEIKDGIDLGYRESKIGIIKYKITNGKTYQILIDEETEMNNLFQEEDQNYVSIANIQKLIVEQPFEETKDEKERTLVYQLKNELIEIKTDKIKIHTMKITTNNKRYTISIK